MFKSDEGGAALLNGRRPSARTRTKPNKGDTIIDRTKHPKPERL